MASKASAAPLRPRAVGPKAEWDGAVWREGEFWYDERAADKAAAFFPRHLRLTEGEWAGRPFVLEEWEEHDVVRPVFGWKRKDGTRRYRRCFVWIARKNGKTELAAGIALLMLLGDAEIGGQVFSIASEKDQAAIVFSKATAMVARSPTLSAILETYKQSIYCGQLNASFRPLSGKAEGKHGLNMSGLIGDEIHEWPNGDLYTFIHDSAAARRQPLEFLISTAGTKGTHGEEIWNECQALLAGDIVDPETLVVVYAADPEDDWTSPETWKKANPNLGVSVKVDALAAACRQARQLPRLENDFKRYRLNMWTEQAVRWLPIDAVDDDGGRFGWDHCVGDVAWDDPAFESRLIGKTCYGGLDLSAVNDLSALVWWFPVQDGLDRPVVLCRFWKPGDLVKAHSRRDRLPYEAWVKSGAILATSGNVIDYAFIQRQIYQDAERYRVAFSGAWNREAGEGGLAIDRWNATETAVKLDQEGIPVVLFGQGFASMSAPSKELERLVMANAFDHGGHPVLRKHAQAVAIQTDPAGNIKPAKNRSSMRIDGIVALIMANGIAVRPDTTSSVYSERGLLVA